MNKNELHDFSNKIGERTLLLAKQKGITNVSFVLEMLFDELMGEFRTICRLKKISFYKEISILLGSYGYKVNEVSVGTAIRRIKDKKNFVDEFKIDGDSLDSTVCSDLERNIQDVLNEGFQSVVESSEDTKLTAYLRKYIKKWDKEVQPLCKVLNVNYMEVICEALKRSGFDSSNKQKVAVYIGRARG